MNNRSECAIEILAALESQWLSIDAPLLNWKWAAFQATLPLFAFNATSFCFVVLWQLIRSGPLGCTQTSSKIIRAPDKWSKAKEGSVFFLLRKAIEVWIMYINAKQTVKGEKKETNWSIGEKENKYKSKVGCKRLKKTQGFNKHNGHNVLDFALFFMWLINWVLLIRWLFV